MSRGVRPCRCTFFNRIDPKTRVKRNLLKSNELAEVYVKANFVATGVNPQRKTDDVKAVIGPEPVSLSFILTNMLQEKRRVDTACTIAGVKDPKGRCLMGIVSEGEVKVVWFQKVYYAGKSAESSSCSSDRHCICRVGEGSRCRFVHTNNRYFG